MKNRLKIALFSDSCLPVLNGVSISIDLLVRELRNQGHSVHVYTAAHFKFKDSDPNTFRFPAVQTPWTRGYPLAFPPFYPMLMKFRRNHYDVIHTHTPFTIGFVGLRWAQSHEIPVVTTYHTLYDRYAHYIPGPRRYIRYKIAKHTNFYYNRVDRIITPSEASSRWLSRHNVTQPIHVIPTGTPGRSMLDRAEIRHSLGIEPEHRVMLYVGRLAKEKNLETLFGMAAKVMADDSFARLWLVGDGPFRAECAEMARNLGIGDRVRFVGFVAREEVDRYYAAADLFVFSSITETQGLVVQEAMTYGLPAVVVAGGGAGAAIEPGENGFLVKNEVEDFASTVLRVFGDDHLHGLLCDGASRLVRSFTMADMTNNVLEVYQEAIGNSVRSPVYR